MPTPTGGWRGKRAVGGLDVVLPEGVIGLVLRLDADLKRQRSKLAIKLRDM